MAGTSSASEKSHEGPAGRAGACPSTHTHLFQCKPLRSVLNKPSTSIDFMAIFAILFCSYNRITRFFCSSSHQVIQRTGFACHSGHVLLGFPQAMALAPRSHLGNGSSLDATTVVRLDPKMGGRQSTSFLNGSSMVFICFGGQLPANLGLWNA